VRAAGTDVPPEEVQAAINSLAQQVTVALNDLDTGAAPSGPAGGDLGGTYPNPTVVALHVASGTESGVTITGSTLDSSPVGATTPSTGAFTTLTATTPVGVASGGTGQNTLSAHNVLLGEGTGGVGFAAPSTAGKMLISAGAAVDPAFANNPAIIAGTVDNTPVGATTPSTGAFTTLTATTPVGVASGGTGRATLLAHGVLVGEGTSGINQLAVGNTGQMLLGSSGADPGFGNNPTITGGTIDGVVIGGTTPAAGHFTTVSATGAISPSSTNGIVGTTTNDSANAGSVGEYVTATGTAVSLTTATPANITSISLTAGDWEVSGSIGFNPAGGAAPATLAAGANTTTATLPASPFVAIIQATLTANAQQGFAVPPNRVTIAGTTTVFLVAQANFGAGTCTGTAVIRARRVR
jgi:hypothetical protein